MAEKDYSVEVAKIFKGRENKTQIGNIVGKVVEKLPELKISILNGEVILYREQLYMCNSLMLENIRKYQTSTDKSLWNTENYFKFTEELKQGDEVLLSHTADEQTWFIIDKITKL
ncbi:DUF2577 family protein [Tepidibacter mesophilus]|uniref:DUF2577 family protein n=1 Tax=Tepidibacter mesophilus TaxID=655607 RepID=UPI0016514801|nr:DUF2577 family protein [Tepidibacter mesophilus]